MRKFKLLKDHPYAKAGTIVEEYERKNSLGRVEVIIPDVQIINIPLDVENEWLEEVKEELMCSKEFSDFLKSQAELIVWSKKGEETFFEWLDRHTLKTEE